MESLSIAFNGCSHDPYSRHSRLLRSDDFQFSGPTTIKCVWGGVRSNGRLEGCDYFSIFAKETSNLKLI